ncbi:uncharacterized protein LOC144906451 [Branchiostoma floridae x Branchiostoma belcheri]
MAARNNSSRKEPNAVLLVTDQYATSHEDDVSTMNRQVVQILTGAGRKVYCLVLEHTEEDRKCAEADGVELILPTPIEGDTRKPCLDWLTFDHRIRYPRLPQDIGWIVGHADVTSRAAAAIMEQRFPQASISILTQTIPEDTEKYKEEEKAMGIGKKEDSIRQDAEKAKTLFSVGHRTHDHFTNTIRAIPKDKRPVHKLFLPEPSKIFQETTVEYVESREKVVLLISRVKEVGKLKGLDFVAKSLARVAERSHERIQLRIRGVSEEEYQASMKILQTSINSGKLIPTLLPHGTQEDICRDMQQAHLVLMPSRTEPFGLIGLEAMAAGVPVLISDQSGLATLVSEVIPEFHHSVLAITGNDSTDVTHWASQIEKVLRMSKAEFSRAAALKQRLLESRYWEEYHQSFLQACRGSDARQPAQVQKRETDATEKTNEDRKVLKYDQQVKLSITLADSISLVGKRLLLSKLEVMITEDVQSEAIFNERMKMYKQLKSEVKDDTISEEGKRTLLNIINELFTRTVLHDEQRFKETMGRLQKVKAEIRELWEGSVLCKLRFYHRDSQVEFVSACRDGSLSAILTEEYISQELVEICGGMPLHVHIEVDEEDFQRGADLHEGATVTSPAKGDQHRSTGVQVEQVTSQLALLHTSIQPKDVQRLRAASTDSAASLLSTRTTHSTGTSQSADTGYVTAAASILSGDDRQSSAFKIRDDEDPQVNLNLLLAELNTPAVKRNKAQQLDLHCQIGDLHRTKLHNSQSALQYYQNMLECSQELTENNKKAKAYNRLGLTYGMLGKQQEAITYHKQALRIYRIELERETDICVAYKNLASSLALSGQVSDAKSNYESALAVAMETGNKTEQMDIYCKLGDLHREQLHEPQESHKYYTEMLALARDLGRKDWESQAYNRLGRAHYDMGEHEESLEWHKKDLKMSQESGDKTEQITAHQNIADSYKALGKLDLAGSHYQSAMTIAMETGNRTQQMDIYCRLGDLHREQLHEPQESHKYYTEMLALARDLGRKEEEVLAYNRLGAVHYVMGEYEGSLEWDKKGLKMSQESGDKTGQITAHQNIADSYKALGKLDLARSHYQSAMTITMETGNKTEQMDIYCKLGDLHRKQLHEPQESHKYYTEMLALARDLGRKDRESQAYNRFGRAHYDMGEHEESLEWHKKDLKMSQESGDKTEQITAHQNIADSYKALGKLDLARSHYQSAMTIAMETGNKTQQMDIYCKLGDLHREQVHEPQESHKYYTEMLALARDLGRKDREGLAYNRLGVGHAHYDMGEHEESLEWSKKTLKMRQESGDKTQQIIAHQNIAVSYKALGKLDLARSHYQSAMTIAMETGNKTQQMDIYLQLGDLHREQLHEPQESHKYYTEMLALARDLGRKDREGLAYHRLGHAHYDMGEYEESLEWDKKYLKMSQESGDKTGQIKAHQNIADSYKALGKLDLARSHYQSAMTIAMETGNKQQQEDIAKELANL